jgi:asparagine synthase (glutamine-hydrolysing)
MCGIAGILNPAGRNVEPGLLGRMIDRIRYRGPDFRGAWVEGQVGLAHARLSIIDLAAGRQPMHNEDRSLTITFNGEIFNYVELRQALRARGHRFATDSDTEVILRLYEEKGEDCVQDLNGDWAFALWDSRRKTLFCSRDRMGVRPLYWTRASGGAFVFASEVKALLAHPRVRRAPDLAALDQIFTFWCSLAPRTMFQGISELPPGHCLTVRDGKIEVRRYWSLNYKEIPEQKEEQSAEQLMALLVDATRIRLRADVPVGAYLSGGLDSSLASAIARRFTATDLKTFSVAFEDPQFDESSYQHEVAKLLGTQHREVRCSPEDIARVFPEVVWHAERPILRTAPAPLYILSKLVRESGYKVVLTGEGSDEILGGYDIFKEAKVRRFCAAQPLSKVRPLLLKRLYPYLPGLQSQSVAWLRVFFRAGPEQLASPFFSHLPRWELTASVKRFYSDEVSCELQSENHLQSLEAQLPDSFSSWGNLEQAQYLESTLLLPGYILSAQGDRVAMAHAVEGRFPFLDHRVVELAGTLPARLKMKVLKEKYLLKRCARDLLPASVRERHKQPYRAPDAACFLAGAGGEYAREMLSEAQVRKSGLFHAPAVQKLLAKALAGKASGQALSLKDNMALVGILSSQIFMHRFAL